MLWWTVAILIAIAAAFAPADAGHRLVVHLDQPFEVAGEAFAGGTLSVRAVQTYSPVSTLDEVCVDGRCIGLLLSRPLATGPAANDALVFTRAASGVLVLRGLTLAGEPERELAQLAPSPVAGVATTALVAEADDVN
jgi:hypothetical protein